MCGCTRSQGFGGRLDREECTNEKNDVEIDRSLVLCWLSCRRIW